MSTETRERGFKGNRRKRIAAQLLLLLGIPVASLLSLLGESLWNAIFDTVLPPDEQPGLYQFYLAVVGTGVGVGVWVLAWITINRPRAHGIALLVVVLSGPGLVNVELASRAHHYSGAAVAEQAARERAFAAQDRETEARRQGLQAAFVVVLHQWTASLAKGGTATFPPVAAGAPLGWNGRSYTLPVGSIPSPGSPIYPITGDSHHLVVQWDDNSAKFTQKSRLFDLTPSGPATVVDAGSLSGVAVSPAGDRYAYAMSIFPSYADPPSTAAPSSAVIVRSARTQAVVATLTVPFASYVLGWNKEGLVASDGDSGSALLVWPDGTGSPRRLEAPPGQLSLPPRGLRALSTRCFRQGNPNRGFSVSRWPASYELWARSCSGYAEQQRVWIQGRSQIDWTGHDALGLSPDGRYLVRADLEVVDLDTHATTDLAPGLKSATAPLFDAEIRGEDPIGLGLWHGDRSVEITETGIPIAVCALPSGPCLRTGFSVAS